MTATVIASNIFTAMHTYRHGSAADRAAALSALLPLACTPDYADTWQSRCARRFLEDVALYHFLWRDDLGQWKVSVPTPAQRARYRARRGNLPCTENPSAIVPLRPNDSAA